MEELKLIGKMYCPFVYRVVWALKLKGIEDEYIEEDFSNKSPLLLQSNPVHKKVPVLIHGGKPLCESSVILEYIEEVWPQNPLLPSDPYGRAMARFWIKFADDKGTIIWKIRTTRDEEQQKVIEDCVEMLKTVEEDCLGDKKFFGGDKIGVVDLAFGGLAYAPRIIEHELGRNPIDLQMFPRLNAWIKNFMEVPEIKESFTDLDRLLKPKTSSA